MGHRIGEGSLKERGEVCFGAIFGGKFGIAMANIFLTSDAGPNPLPDVATKMQHQIADGVHILIRALPNLFLRERV
jgi:hypothetical protein